MIAAMKTIRNLPDIPSDIRNAVIAIGNFDGVHIGHRALLERAAEIAAKDNAPFMVLTFEPHPRQFFQPDTLPFRVTPSKVKEGVFQTFVNPDYYVSLPFNAEMAELSAEEFINDILVNQCRAGTVVVGDNFHFGKGRSGNIRTLQGRDHFQTIAFGIIDNVGEEISSSRIREHLKNAEIDEANAILGWNWIIEGEVVHGDKRGRELGYPTANMRFGECIVPSYGIYAVRVKIEGENQWRIGAANIGTRPMFESEEPLLETFIFDFEGDLYGKVLKVQPVIKLRDEMKFASLDDLITQMDKDCDNARKHLQA